MWGLPAEQVVTAVRRDADVKADRSVFSTSDRAAVRATCRVGFGSPHTAVLTRIRLGATRSTEEPRPPARIGQGASVRRQSPTALAPYSASAWVKPSNVSWLMRPDREKDENDM